MSPRVPARVVAVALALVLGSAVTTAAVRLRGAAEPVPVSAPTPGPPSSPASPQPSTSTPTPAPPTPTPTPTPAPAPAPTRTEPPTPTRSAPSPTASAGPSARPPRPAALRRALAERLLPPRRPVRRLADDRDGIGLLDATDVAALEERSDRAAAARRLEALGFERALGCGWKDDRRVYLVVVHRFATAAGAEKLVSDVADRRPGPAFRSRTVPEAVAYSGHSVLYWEQSALFARGRYAYRVTYLSRQEDFRHRIFNQLLRRQARHAARLDP